MTFLKEFASVMVGLLSFVLVVGLTFAVFAGHPTGAFYVDSDSYQDMQPQYRVMQELRFRPDHCFCRTPDAGMAFQLWLALSQQQLQRQERGQTTTAPVQ